MWPVYICLGQDSWRTQSFLSAEATVIPMAIPAAWRFIAVRPTALIFPAAFSPAAVHAPGFWPA